MKIFKAMGFESLISFFFFSYQLFPGKGVPSIRVFREESKVGIANQNGLRLLPAENET